VVERIFIVDDVYEIDAGDTLILNDGWVGIQLRDTYINDGRDIYNDPGPHLINRGHILMTNSRTDVIPIDDWIVGIGHDSENSFYFFNSSVTNEIGASIEINHYGINGKATAFHSISWSADFYNKGLVKVTAQKIAIGIETWNGNHASNLEKSNFIFENSGDISIYSDGDAFGTLFYNGAIADNSGLIQVEGGHRAWGVLILGHQPELTNSGTIRAIQSFGIEKSIGVYVSGGVYGSHIINTGVIEADIAIREYDLNPQFGRSSELIENSGLIIGDIELNFGLDEIRNTGEIRGDISFADFADVFDGADGLVVGSIHMGGGDDRVSSGRGDDRIDGGDGDDWIDAGAGDDVIHGGVGEDHIIGGDGWDVVLMNGSIHDYRILRSGDNFIIKGPDGTDYLQGVEVIRFEDGSEIDLARQYGSDGAIASFNGNDQTNNKYTGLAETSGGVENDAALTKLLFGGASMTREWSSLLDERPGGPSFDPMPSFKLTGFVAVETEAPIPAPSHWAWE